MELKDYSKEELKAELKRRSDLSKVEKAKIPRCRNCKHFLQEVHSEWILIETCAVRTYKQKGHIRNYVVKPSNKACELYEPKGQ